MVILAMRFTNPFVLVFMQMYRTVKSTDKVTGIFFDFFLSIATPSPFLSIYFLFVCKLHNQDPFPL